MASKILMGSLPELMETILNNLENDFYSLYSCALVSRHWCKMSIPILWQDPFSFDRKPSFISTYFSSLNDDEKFILKDYGINLEFSKPLFNYVRFLKVLDLFRLEEMTKEWLNLQHIGSILSRHPLICHITNLLFKSFIENGTSLLKLHIKFSDHTKIKPEIFYSLEQNVQFFSQLQDLSLGERSILNNSADDDYIALLKILAKRSTKLRALKFYGFNADYNPQLYHVLVCIINSQEHLTHFTLGCADEYLENFHGIILALESQKQSLREFIIGNCDYNEEFEILMDFKNLEILRIRYCGYAKLLTLSDYKISTLEIVDFSIDASNMVPILEKSGPLLQRLKLESIREKISEQSLLLETLKSFCPNITYLNIYNIEFSSQLLDLIGNLQKLQFLILWDFEFSNNIAPEEQVLQFAKILPSTLQYLDIMDSYFEFFIDILLSNCYAPLKKLLIYGIDNEKKAKALIDFCIRKSTLNYVGVNEYLDNKFKKDVEGYVPVVPCNRVVVDC